MFYNAIILYVKNISKGVYTFWDNEFSLFNNHSLITIIFKQRMIHNKGQKIDYSINLLPKVGCSNKM